MEEQIKEQPKGADLLERISAERFRRKLLISSRVIALLLIAALVWWGWIYVQYGKAVANDPCWACGYYGGKRCEPVLFENIQLNGIQEEEYRKELAKYNSNYNYSVQFDRFERKMRERINFTDFRLIVPNQS